MPKGNTKSSATSGTRKKHLKKHAPPEEQHPKEKRPKGKGKKNEPRVKMYIPPVKPAPVQPDPLETTGLVHTLPADLLVVLRNISKKAQVTKTRALEELQSTWVNQCLKEGRESLITDTLVVMLPVWLHHISALFVNPSRRVRVLTASLHAVLLQIPPVRDQIVYLLRESLPESQLESILGTWCLATHDIDRQVSTTAAKAWKETVSSEESPKTFLFTDNLRTLVSTFVQRVALDPSGVYDYLNPQPPPPPPVHVSANKRGTHKSGGKGPVVSTSRQDEGDMTPRSKSDEQEESESDRRARLRIGALGAARWIAESTPILTEDLLSFYSNPALWTTLHSVETSPWVEVESFGWAQPNVRKAGWSLVQALLNSHKSQLEPVVPVIGTAILRSSWIELDTLVQGSMWQPLLLFLKQFPHCWTVDASQQAEEHDASDSTDSDDEQRPPKPSTPPTPSAGPSQAYNEFLGFLQLGCSGSPIQGYPAVVIIVSTIPSSIFVSSALDEASSPLSHFLSSFWAALDGRALSSLHRVAASAAFLSSLLECTVFLIKRMRNPNDSAKLSGRLSAESASEDLIRGQFSHVWEELTSGKLKVEERAAARLLAQTLEALHAADRSLLNVAWSTLVDGLKASVAKQENSGLVSAILKVFYDRFRKEDSLLKTLWETLMDDILHLAVNQCESSLRTPAIAQEMEDHNQSSGFSLLVSILDRFRDGLFSNEAFSDNLDSLFAQDAYRLLALCTSLLLSYLLHRKNESKVLAVWHSLLSSIASSAESNHLPDQKSIGILLDAAQKHQLPKYLTPQDGELDGMVDTLLENCLAEPLRSQDLSLVKQILVSSDHFISPSAVNTLWQVIISTLTSNVHGLLQGERVHIPTIDACIDLIQASFGKDLPGAGMVDSVLPDIFLYSFLIPIATAAQVEEMDVTPSQKGGKDLWNDWIKVTKNDAKKMILNTIKDRLKGLMNDTTVQPMPEDVLNLLRQDVPGFLPDALQDILPSSAHLDAALKVLSPDVIDPSVAVLEDLIPPPNSPTSSQGTIRTPIFTDRRGFSAYARSVYALIHALGEDRQLARRNFWALRHFFALSVYAQDILNVPSAISRSPVFDDKVNPAALVDIVARARQVSVYLLNSSAAQDDGKWRRLVLERLLNEGEQKNPQEGLSQLQALLFNIISHSKSGDGLRDARVLKMALDPLLQDGVDSDEADLWVQFSRKIERTAPQTAMTIIASITRSGAEPAKLDRYRNELAANIPGIKPAKANTEGLLSLRRLAASAPDPDGDVVFLQPTRAVNVVKGCQAWVLMEDDEDELDEEVESAMLPIFMHLAPILQNVPGSHWAFMFDVLEAVLDRVRPTAEDEEEDDRDESITLVALARALRLLKVFEELAKRNKALMAEWTDRRMAILTIVRDLKIIGNDTEIATSVPRSACRELVLSIVQHLPSSLIDENTLPKMCHLIEDPCVPVQRMAYQLLKVAAQKRTEHFVIEAGVDTEATVKALLPMELLNLLRRDIHSSHDADVDVEEDSYSDPSQNVFGHLLGWMILFDLFQDASFKVKSSYIEQLRNLNLILDHFIPCFLGLLRLDQGSLGKAFKLDLWAVDRFYVDLYEPGSPHAISVLTAHLYYRALLAIPSLIHSWILDCKDRQLTNTVTTYTSTYFSPVLIRSELEHVRSHATKDGLADENMTVKVANAVNEVAAAYSVDEHQLEIKLRIPGDWPLHKIEIRDVKRVGVDENRWRAWVLGVQQTIWAHNGRIIDGLGLFKKNVTLHFEGQVECAICYSIISVMDGTLPKKPCKTCKNRFHAGCLYKWFNTSHSSSCPLCRSDII